jgi:hypothetical protein
MKERNLLIAVAALVIVVAIAFAFASPRTSRFGSENETTEVASAGDQPERPRLDGARLCASSAGFQQLKAAAFREAISVRGDSGNLDRLAATSVVRMEGTEVTSEDAGTGLVTCTGRFVIELPPGAERGFGGQRRLSSDVTYTAQASEGGGAAVYQLISADELVSSLAAFDIDTSLQPAEVEVAEASPPEEQLPVIIRREPAERPQPREEAREEPKQAPRPTPPPARAAREEDDRPQRTPPARAEREEPKERTVRPRPEPRTQAPEPRPARTTARPSFNCRQAGTRSERLVCSSERLAAKDRAMSNLFFSAYDAADARRRAELQRTRNRFLAYRERCANEACISEAYDGRMQEIRDIMEAE